MSEETTAALSGCADRSVRRIRHLDSPPARLDGARRLPRSYPPEFRRKVLDLIAAGRTVAQVAHDLRIHAAARGVYGARRVHAELTLGHGVAVSHGTVELLMQRAGIKGLPGNRRRRPRPEVPTAADLVDRDFVRDAPNRLWITDITEHRTREGRRDAPLVTNALGMAIHNRQRRHSALGMLTPIEYERLHTIPTVA